MSLTQAIETAQMIENVMELGTNIALSFFQSSAGRAQVIVISLNTEGADA
jgi:hypothetical protein